MTQAPVRLQDLSSSDKTLLMAAAHKSLLRAGLLWLPPFLLLGGAVIYMNNRPESLGLYNENLRGSLSLFGVLLSLLALRLFANHVIHYGKSARSWQKKVFTGEVTGLRGTTVFAVGQEFTVSHEQAATLQQGDKITAELSVPGNFLLLLEKC